MQQGGVDRNVEKNTRAFSLSPTLKAKARYYGQEFKGAELGKVRSCENGNV